MENRMNRLRAWLDEQRDVPLERMSDFFDRRIEGYDEHMLANGDSAYRVLAEMLPENVCKLLDLGCGTGLELNTLWRRLPDVRVTGVDLTQSMLDALHRKFDGRPFRTICGDYFQVDFGEQAWDAVLTFESLHHFPDEQKLPLYRKIRRSLRPGGVFLYGDYFASCDEEERLLAEECARKRALSGIPADAFVHFDVPLTLPHELQLLEQAGLALRTHRQLDESTHILLLEPRTVPTEGRRPE